jgi:hypothetical protein
MTDFEELGQTVKETFEMLKLALEDETISRTQNI